MMWVKTDVRNEPYESLVFGYHKGDSDFYYLFDSPKQNKIYNRKKYSFASTVDDTDRQSWRHLTHTYDDHTSRYRLYLNGNKWPFSSQSTSTSYSSREINTVYIGTQRTGHHRFYGSMACIMIFDRALTAGEIKSVRSLCG